MEEETRKCINKKIRELIEKRRLDFFRLCNKTWQNNK